MDEKILTRHPQGKKGVHIDRSKYETMRKTILQLLQEKERTPNELTNAVNTVLAGKFDGSIPWYMESTKLDLEARKVIERVEGDNHDVYRVKKG